MNILRFTDQEFTQRLQAVVHHSSLFDPVIEERTRTIVEAVRTRGDAALLELTERFDGAKLRADQLAISAPELLEASLQATPHLRTMISAAARNIELFSRKSLRRNWSTRNRQGGKVGE